MVNKRTSFYQEDVLGQPLFVGDEVVSCIKGEHQGLHKTKIWSIGKKCVTTEWTAVTPTGRTITHTHIINPKWCIKVGGRHV